jgi:arginase family enzyme
VTLYGSGDFHHVSLALLRRLPEPVNLLVIDNHPDWMRGVPFMHCGTWVYHAARLPQVQRIYHAGGDVDFDNYYRWLAPWRLLRQGKIVVLPGVRRFQGGRWARVPHHPLRSQPDRPTAPTDLAPLFEPWAADLAGSPLYISLDKDVLYESEAVVNWDSGHLTLTEVRRLIETFLGAAHGRLAGMDITGDWSAVRLSGLFRRLLHWTEHPALHVDPAAAAARNQETNFDLLETVRAFAA